MIYNLIITAILMVAFFMSVGAYCLGHKHQKMLNSGNIPKVNINPVKAIKEAVETHTAEKQAETVANELDEVMSFTKEKALEAIKRGDVVEQK